MVLLKMGPFAVAYF